MRNTIGFALVGCGRIAQRYLGLLGQGEIENAKLVAVCDIQLDRAEASGKKAEVPVFSDMHEMIAQHVKDIDVVCVLTESGRHAEHVIQLAKHGKHILVEKPMALRLEDAEKMATACEKAGVRLFVVKQNRLNLPVQKMREALDRGRFGKLVMGTVRVRWCRTQAYYDQDSWRGTWQFDGGVFANQASHHIDLLMWMLGEPVSVFAKTRRALADIETEDTGVAVITFANGAIGVAEATTATRPIDLEGSLSLLGETGTVEIGGFAVNQMKVWRFSQGETGDDLVVGNYGENPPDVYGFGHRRYLQRVVHTLRENAPTFVDGVEGMKSLKLIHAIYESAETGRVIELEGFRPHASRLGKPG